MEIHQDDYILGYWFASDGHNNLYILVNKNQEKWKGKITFRSHRDDDPHSGKDHKITKEICFPLATSEKEVIKKASKLFNELMRGMGMNDYQDSFLVQGDIDKFLKIAATKHYMHIKVEDIKEMEQ